MKIRRLFLIIEKSHQPSKSVNDKVEEQVLRNYAVIME